MNAAAPPSPLVDVAWLAARLRDPGVRVVDCRWVLGAAGRGAEEHRRGHIPGAVHADVDADLSGGLGAQRGSPARSPQASTGPPGPGRHPIPSADAFARTLARLGVTPGALVVAYDDAGGAIAARLWWLLRYFGLGGAGRVLDGGIQAWIAAGQPLETGEPAVAPAPLLELTPGGAPVADKADVDRRRRDPAAVILDARARERYEGRSEPIDARAGHIPGARSAPFAGNLRAPGGPFLDRDALERRYLELGALDAGAVVCYCGSGVTACHALLALDLLGRSDAILYEGSWSDWARDPALPAAEGAEP
jgi:thiosulfate/3-mercaptopyruvate sulfurtransferase